MKSRKKNVHDLKPGDIIKVDLDIWGDGKCNYDVGGIRYFKVLKLFEHHVLCESLGGYPWLESFHYYKLQNILISVSAA